MTLMAETKFSCDIRTHTPAQKVMTEPICYFNMLYKLAWAWAWVWV